MVKSDRENMAYLSQKAAFFDSLEFRWILNRFEER